jgi:hypothetical protein
VSRFHKSFRVKPVATGLLKTVKIDQFFISNSNLNFMDEN